MQKHRGIFCDRVFYRPRSSMDRTIPSAGVTLYGVQCYPGSIESNRHTKFIQALVVQWIEQFRPKEKILVRFRVRAQVVVNYITSDIIILMSSDEEEHNEILRLLRENQTLIKENNKILQKLHRHNVIGFIVRIVWYALLIGLPFALYFYILEPYFNAFGANYEVFRQGMAETPGLKGFEKVFPFFFK